MDKIVRALEKVLGVCSMLFSLRYKIVFVPIELLHAAADDDTDHRAGDSKLEVGYIAVPYTIDRISNLLHTTLVVPCSSLAHWAVLDRKVYFLLHRGSNHLHSATAV